jgi:hypothetical protein
LMWTRFLQQPAYARLLQSCPMRPAGEEEDLSPPDHIQAIAQTAAFHFGTRAGRQ